MGADKPLMTEHTVTAQWYEEQGQREEDAGQELAGELARLLEGRGVNATVKSQVVGVVRVGDSRAAFAGVGPRQF